MQRHIAWRREAHYLLLILLPLIFYGYFVVLPLGKVAYFSLLKWNKIQGPITFYGLGNYLFMFTKDVKFYSAFRNTLIFTVASLVGKNIPALGASLLLKRSCGRSSLFRTIYIAPFILSSATTSFIWKFIYEPNLGTLNVLFRQFGFDGLARIWLADNSVVMYCIALVGVWSGYGYNMILYIAGLNTIPEDLYECAKIEGANGWQSFWHITFPLLEPVHIIIIMLTTIGSFKSFDLVYMMTGGGADRSSEVLATLLYREGFEFTRIGYSCAVSVILMLVVGFLSALQYGLVKRRGS